MLALLFVYGLVQIGPPTAEFDRGKAAYERAEYPRAIEILRPLLYPEIRLETEGQVVEAHRMLGVAHLFENHPDEAKREFRKLLELRPDYRFDPLLDPPSSEPTGVARACQNIDHSEEDLSRNLTRLQVVSGGLFFVTAIW